MIETWKTFVGRRLKMKEMECLEGHENAEDYKDGVTFHPVYFFLFCCSANMGPTVNAQLCSPARGPGDAWYRLAVSESESGKVPEKLHYKDLIVCTNGGLGS